VSAEVELWMLEGSEFQTAGAAMFLFANAGYVSKTKHDLISVYKLKLFQKISFCDVLL